MDSASNQSLEEYCEKLISKLKQDPKWELQQDFGKMLMKHIDTLTPSERKRYDELQELLK